MARIIAGRFETRLGADAAAELLTEYLDDSDICIFHNNPPGQHDAYPVGGDEDADPGAEGAGEAATGSAVAAGLAAGAVGAIGGPVVALAAAGVGAYMGSLAGAVSELGDNEQDLHRTERRPGGVMLSVRVAVPVNEARVIATLRSQGAMDIEHAEGKWNNGDWTDFNPVAVPRLVDKAPQRS